MYAKKQNVSQVNFLASSRFQAFTTQVEQTCVTADENGRKIVPAGTVYPANDATAKGILLHDVDVTNGSQAGSLIVEGYVIAERLPTAPTPEAKAAMQEIKYR